MRPLLKSVVWERAGAELRVVYDRRGQLLIEDPDGGVERLLELLSGGESTVAGIGAALGIAEQDVEIAICLLDEHGLIEDGCRLGTFDARDQERYFSNIAFFESFSSLARSREDFQRKLRRSHVLVLGTGGLNSNVLPHLCGLGVGRLTLLDRDEVELRNFARQYLYRHADIGSRKVQRAAEWVREFDPDLEVATVDAGITGLEMLDDLIKGVSPDVVASGVDYPADIDQWVNAACVANGVPYVRGGMYVTEGIVWSVDPGRSACYMCPRSAPLPDAAGDPDLATVLAGLELSSKRPRINRGIGPVAGILGSLAAFEVLRYLTRFEPPAYAGRAHLIDFADGCASRYEEWNMNPNCPVCVRGGEPNEDQD